MWWWKIGGLAEFGWLWWSRGEVWFVDRGGGAVAGEGEEDPLVVGWVARRKIGWRWRRVVKLEGLGGPFYRRVEGGRDGRMSPE